MRQLVKKMNWLNVGQLIIAGAMALMPLFTPLTASAQIGSNPVGSQFQCDPTSGLNCGNRTLGVLFKTIIQWALGIAFAVAVIFLIYGGFLYITSGGNEEQATKGKSAVVNALIGIVVIILSFVIVNVVANLASGTGSGGLLGF